jgi:DNA polymerase-3 subunit gamma/tau
MEKMKPYLVFARKYRPTTFDEVIGQKPIVQTLKNAIIQNRVAHAYLFSGMRGVGKTTVARILAKALNCESGPTPNPCNKCQFCISINEDRAVDVLEIDGASNRGIDEVRGLREGIRYKPIQSRYKVIIIDEVHMLTNEAFNALLKTLEEPPPHTIFIFATTEFHKVPATILSRCQHFEFRRISQKEIITQLSFIAKQEGIKISPFGIGLIAQKSEGSLRDAQSLLDQIVAYSGEEVKDDDIKEILGLIDRQIFSATIEAIASEKPEEIFPLIDKIINYGYDLRYFYRELIKYLRNLLLIKVVKESDEIIELNEEDVANLKKDAEKLREEDIFRYLSILQQAEPGLRYSSHPRIYLETVLLKLAHLKKLVPIQTIIQDLENIKKGVLQVSAKEIHQESPKEEKIVEEEKRIEEEKKESIPEKEISIAESDEIYRKFLNELQSERASLMAIISQNNLFKIEDNRIKIGFSPDKKFFMDKTKKEIEILEKIATKILNKKIKIEIVENIGKEEKKTQKEREYELALSDSTVKNFMDLFKAEIISIEPIKK